MNNEFIHAWKARQSAEHLNAMQVSENIGADVPGEGFFQKLFSWLKGNPTFANAYCFENISENEDEHDSYSGRLMCGVHEIDDACGNYYGFPDEAD